MYKDPKKKVLLKAILNKKNNQINFSLKKRELPKGMSKKLPTLKSIKFSLSDMEFK